MSNLKTAAICAALTAGCLVGGTGCDSMKSMMGGGSSSTPDTSGMSKEQAMTQGQQMVNQGQTMQTDAANVPDGGTQNGMSKEDMMAKAKDMIQKGQAMMEKAKSM